MASSERDSPAPPSEYRQRLGESRECIAALGAAAQEVVTVTADPFNGVLKGVSLLVRTPSAHLVKGQEHGNVEGIE